MCLELHKGVFDIIVPPDFHINPMMTPKILVCQEISPKSILSGVFANVLSCLQSTIESVNYQQRIGIITFDSTVTFYNVPESIDEKVSQVKSVDPEDSFVTLGDEDLLQDITIEEEKARFTRLIETLYLINDEKTELFSQNKYDTKPVFGAVVSLVADLFENIGGRAMIFSSNPCRNGPGKFTDENSPEQEQPFTSKNTYFQDLAYKCNKNRTSIDLFQFDNPEFQLATIGPLTSQTGGTLYHYPLWDSFQHTEKLYYQIYRNMTRYVGHEVACRIRCTNSVNLQHYYTPAGKCASLDFQIAAQNADQYVAMTFEPNTQSDHMIYFQFVALHSNIYGQRILRVINCDIEAISKDNSKTLYSKLHNDTILLQMIRKIADDMKSTKREDLRVQVINDLKGILKEFQENSHEHSPQEITVPKRIDQILVLIHSLQREPVFNTKNNALRPDIIYANLLFFQQQSIEIIHNHLYPKVFPIHELFEQKDKKVDQTILPGTIQESGTTVLPSTVPCNINCLDSDGVYFIDCGYVIYLYIRKEINEYALADQFNCEAINELYNTYEFPYNEENDTNVRANNILAEQRVQKNGYYPPLVIIIEDDVNEPVVKERLIENPTQGYKPDAWGFMKQINSMMN